MNINDLSAKDYSIEEYLIESKTFLIPRYQRSYAWEKRNIVQLLEDVSKEEGYYIGNVIVNTLQNNEKEIIDGQQRIISIFFDSNCTSSCCGNEHIRVCVRQWKFKNQYRKENRGFRCIGNEFYFRQ